MGGEVATRTRKAPAHRSRSGDGPAASPAGPRGAGPGNRAVLGLLAGLGGRPVMRAACSSCADELGTGISRKADCGCGGPCCDEEPSVSRKADGGGGGGGEGGGSVASVVSRPGLPLDRATRRRMERSFGRDLSHVRVHTDADGAASARRLNARAYTVGDHIVFGSGRYAPERTEGQRLLAHELTHTVQQRSGRFVQPSGSVSRPTDRHEREADAVADAVVAGHTVSPTAHAEAGVAHRSIGGWLLDKAESAVDAVGDAADAAVEGVADAGEAVYEAGEAVYEAGAEVVEAGVEFAGDVVEGIQWAWDLAHDIAAAIGGMVSVSGCGISIDVPPLDIPYALTLEVPVPALSLSFPLAAARLPLGGNVFAYGEVYLNTTLAPSLSLQLGPASFNGLRIAVDWCAPSFYGAGSLSWTFAAALGAQLRGGIGGEVGVTVVVPVYGVPVPIDIPVVSLDAGVLGALLGVGVTNVTHSVALGYGGGTLHYGAETLQDVGLRLSAGVGAFGSLTVLGINLCTLYWPWWRKAWETSFSFDRGIDLSVGTGGVTAGYSASLRQPGHLDFSDFPVFLETDVLTDDCPLLDAVCRVLHAMGWMPSQRGVAFSRHPWPGPLTMDMKDPGIPSTAKCRGACGPDCDTCDPIGDKWVCVDDATGHHSWVHYPNVDDCPTHAACRQHDACYDWCGSGGPSGVGPLLCRRLCDLECICEYSPVSCIGWIFGEGGDDRMQFSDPPVSVPGCEGPCPTASTDEAGTTTYRLCLPRVDLSPPVTVGDRFNARSDPIALYNELIFIPNFGPVQISVVADGSVFVEGSGTIGPVFLDNVCLDVDPTIPRYSGTASVVVEGALNASAGVTGRLDANAHYACIVPLLGATGSLTATGRASLPVSLTDTLTVGCDRGEINLVNTATFAGSLGLGFDLDAELILRLLGFEVYQDTWNLLSLRKEWPFRLDLQVGSGVAAGVVLPVFALGAVGVVELLRFLLDRDHEHEEEDASPGIVRRLLSLCAPTSPAPSTGPCASPVNDGTTACGSTTLPLSVVNMTGTGRGETVTAQPLTRCPGNTTGSPPGNGVFPNLMACHRAAGQPHSWPRAHLLHGDTGNGRHLHGPGIAENLIFTDSSINGLMRTRVERDAIAAIRDQNKVIWYETVVDHMDSAGQQRFYGRRVHMAWGEFDPLTNTRCTPIFNDWINSNTNRVPPPCPPPYP